MSKKSIEICFVPEEFEGYFSGQEIVVVIDVLRATTAICSALDFGVNKIIPVATVEEAKAYKAQGYFCAAERNGQVLDGFEFGNSPIKIRSEKLKDQSLVITTTNGTRAIKTASVAKQVIIASFMNLDAVCEYLIEQQKDVLIVGSGWKSQFNLEDTICAGAIADKVLTNSNFSSDFDSTVAAKYLFRSAKDNIFGYLKSSSHRRRLRKLNLNEDIKFCLTANQTSVLPVLINGEIVKLNTK